MSFPGASPEKIPGMVGPVSTICSAHGEIVIAMWRGGGVEDETERCATEVLNVDPTWADSYQPWATGDRHVINPSHLVYYANMRFGPAL